MTEGLIDELGLKIGKKSRLQLRGGTPLFKSSLTATEKEW